MLAMLAVGGLLVAACSPQSPEERLAAYNKKLGPQAEYTGTHLFIRWPASGVRIKPVTLKIPREYLDSTPVFKDEAGGIEKVYLNLALPDATSWQPMPRPKATDSAQTHDAFKSHLASRKFVILDRAPSGNLAWRNSIRRDGQGASPGYSRDGSLGGLERYSPTRCLDANGSVAQAFINGKELDDDSPPNCRRDRGWALLVSTNDVEADKEGVAVRCMSMSCAVYFVGGTRGVRIRLEYDQLPHWKQYVEPIRKRIDSFVVDGSP